MNRADSLNIIRIKEIISAYGYPGKILVGVPTNEAAWHVIQHSSYIKALLPLVKDAAKKGDLPYYRYAQMLDRSLQEEGKMQIYGTQVYGMNVFNSETGSREWQMFVWPIERPDKVNMRRKKAGFEKNIDEYAKTFGVKYKVLSLEDVARMQATIGK